MESGYSLISLGTESATITATPDTVNATMIITLAAAAFTISVLSRAASLVARPERWPLPSPI
jgi:hypothetical protein